MATKKTNSKHMDALSASLMMTFEPLVKALDFTLDDYGVGQEQHDAADTGHDRPSMRDNGLRFLIGSQCQAIWRQAHGVIRSKDGKTTYNNAAQMLARSKTTKSIIEQKASEAIEVEDLEALRWYRINEERLVLLDTLLDAYKTVYREIFHEDWKPMEEAAKPDVKKNITPELTKKYLEMLTASARS